MEWSIQEVARRAGTTSRALRHYGDVGLLPPSRVGANGYRYYDERSLLALQRILLLRNLGLGIPAIAEVLAGHDEPAAALEGHLDWLLAERDRLDRQIATVTNTIEKVKGGEPLVAEELFDGFDHTRYREEVEQRWGAEAYRSSDAWWRAKTPEERAAFQRQHTEIAADYQAARAAALDVESPEVQEIVARHVAWLNLSAAVTGGAVTAARLRGYGEMYVADPRFAANYGGLDGAEFVRDAFEVYAEESLSGTRR